MLAGFTFLAAFMVVCSWVVLVRRMRQLQAEVAELRSARLADSVRLHSLDTRTDHNHDLIMALYTSDRVRRASTPWPVETSPKKGLTSFELVMKDDEPC